MGRASPLLPACDGACDGAGELVRTNRTKGLGKRMYHPELIRHPESCPALVLNADYTPLSYYPLSLWPWQTSIKAMFLERVDVVAHYDREVHSPSVALKLPSVIALRDYVRPNQYPAFTRFNLFLRDKFRCVYCSSGRELTFDHVVPRSKGGRTTWENVATACAPCNLKKGGRTPAEAHMHVHREPPPQAHDPGENSAESEATPRGRGSLPIVERAPISPACCCRERCSVTLSLTPPSQSGYCCGSPDGGCRSRLADAPSPPGPLSRLRGRGEIRQLAVMTARSSPGTSGPGGVRTSARWRIIPAGGRAS